MPKGGGAIRGIGEKFAATPVNGTATLTVPISTSSSRSAVGPKLVLSYDSGAGNGAFGLGWSLAVPSITRKTDKGLPKYRDAEESDLFILSGAEDLVPVLVDVDGTWQRQTLPPRHIESRMYTVVRYRPRTEGLLARIERWTNAADTADTFWRAITQENVTSWYGRTSESRIADPADPTRIFSWLICETYDDKGNVAVYRYETENAEHVDTSQAHERNRGTARGTNRYLKRIQYGNRVPYYPVWDANAAPVPLPSEWLFELVLDYGEHDADAPLPDEPGTAWPRRQDPFSSYRAGFEVRTYRLCQRVLMFHHFAAEDGVGLNCLVRSMDFTYSSEVDPAGARNPIHSFLVSLTESAYKRLGSSYLKRSLPPLEFTYSEPVIHPEVHEVDLESVENVPYGIDLGQYQWVDLDGEGLPGILTEQATGWYYKRNLSPVNVRPTGGQVAVAGFGPVEQVASRPPGTALAAGGQQLLDLAGDGQLDLVSFSPPSAGFYERTFDARWEPFTPFRSLPLVDWRDPNLRFVDLTGDGHADLLISEDELFRWYPSQAEGGFGAAEWVAKAADEEGGPRLVFADAAQSIYLADMSGDGLTDLVRVRNGEVCYWPNLGYGRFGAKVTMDDAPWFEAPDLFEQQRVRLADIDGSGLTDLLYLGRDGVRLYFNQSGNRWSAARLVAAFPGVDNLSAVHVADLLGSGTACLVWSSPLPGAARAPMRYVDLLGGQKPHLLVRAVNNLGAETHVRYAPSTKFYLADQRAGTPWMTRLPFPVHVVERVDTYDRISGNRFVTRYTYHHGYFDGIEREFRGFGRVDQEDTEAYAALAAAPQGPAPTNVDAASHVPPVLTRTWFHTGVALGRDRVSKFFAGLLDAHDRGEYYRPPGLTDAEAARLLLDDTALPPNLEAADERDACRALKGLMLRQEVYALDGTPKQPHPYVVTEQNYQVEILQPGLHNRPGVFLPRPLETFTLHYERNPEPRVRHTLTLEVDGDGRPLKGVSIAYGRAQADSALDVTEQADQTTTVVTYVENRYTNAVDEADAYRTGVACESRSYHLTGYTPSSSAGRFAASDFVEPPPLGLAHVFDSEIAYEESPITGRQRRLIEHVRTLYRPDDMGIASQNPLALLPLGEVQPLALPGESYTLAFTPGLLTKIYTRMGDGQQPEPLLPDPAGVLQSAGSDRGGYVDLDGDGRWWVPSGRTFYSTSFGDSPGDERSYARQHFFLPHRFHDPFEHGSAVHYDTHDLLITRTADALGNTTVALADYRVLRPRVVTDPNGNRYEVAFDTLGFVSGSAVRGKITDNAGDSLQEFEADLDQPAIDAFFADPKSAAADLLGQASTRIVYDLHRYRATASSAAPQPTFAAALAREKHMTDLAPGEIAAVQVSFSYSDGFAREIQKKIQAEPGPAPQRGLGGAIVVVDGRPQMTPHDVSPRWVGSGWTVFNNKGKPVRQFEPFFTDAHRFESDVRIGVSLILFYDPVDRVAATLHPNRTWQKVVFDGWRQEIWDVNDTVLVGAPAADPDAGDLFRRLPESSYLPTWYAQREGGALGPQEHAAAAGAAVHAGTPTVVHLDAVGRTFLTVAHNRFTPADAQPADPPVEAFYRTRIRFDVEGNQREIVDARGRAVMRYDYDMRGTRVHEASMDAGERWMVSDVAGARIRAWDDRGHRLRMEYDELRRLLRAFVRGTDVNRSDPRTLNREVMFQRIEYGEGQDGDTSSNLRTRVLRTADGAGTVTNHAYDFKGNLLQSTRALAKAYKELVDWSAAVELEDDYPSSTTYDALNRVVTLTAPDGSVLRPAYNEANLLNGVEVNLRAAHVDGQPVWTPFVTNIDHDARGQRTLIRYGNGVETRYQYDRDTFRLVRVYTRRGEGFTGDCGADPSFAAPADAPAGTPCGLQSLRYTYDPIGNITHVRDDAQQTVFFRNKRVDASSTYGYDAVYRLIAATGREHLGQNGENPGGPSALSHDDVPRVHQLHPGDGNALGRYVQEYLYDQIGNLLAMAHKGTDPAHPGWTRAYTYNENSPLAPGQQSNRLTRTTVSPTGAQPWHEDYGHDAHGNMTAMPHLQAMTWDFRDRLQMTRRQAVVTAPGEGERTYYVYDAGGTRVRKVTELSTGEVKDERVYVSGFEVYRRYGPNAIVRETLHVMDDQQRIAMIETRVEGTEPGVPGELIRYQFGNHLGSACLELDDQAQIISYQEYYPYGSTSYQGVRSQTEVPRQRYQYTGKERDEETGLSYHGARYYAPWIARWVSCDPGGLQDGVDLYRYAAGNPVRANDPTGGQTNTPQNESDRDVMLKSQAQLLASLRNMSEAQRGELLSKTSGWFKKRVEANLRDFQLPYVLPAAPKTEETATGTGDPKQAAEEENINWDDPNEEFKYYVKMFSKEVRGYSSPEKHDPTRDKNDYSERHIKNVLFVVNTALRIAAQRAQLQGTVARTRREQLVYALRLIMQFRDENNTHDITFRDADHYLSGRLQEWQLRTPGRREKLEGDQEPSEILSHLSTTADEHYDAKKRSGEDVSVNKDRSASPPGNRYWPALGAEHFREHDSGREKQYEVPQQPTEEETIKAADDYWWVNRDPWESPERQNPGYR